MCVALHNLTGWPLAAVIIVALVAGAYVLGQMFKSLTP